MLPCWSACSDEVDIPRKEPYILDFKPNRIMNEHFVRSRIVQLEAELKPYIELMGKAADAIITQDVSTYPIFVIHQHTVDIGLQLIEKSDEGSNWSVNATTLEELATKKIVEMSKVEDFKKVYKDPQEQLCLFVLSDLGANFIFIPR
jgi:hypothetical protein